MSSKRKTSWRQAMLLALVLLMPATNGCNPQLLAALGQIFAAVGQVLSTVARTQTTATATATPTATPSASVTPTPSPTSIVAATPSPSPVASPSPSPSPTPTPSPTPNSSVFGGTVRAMMVPAGSLNGVLLPNTYPQFFGSSGATVGGTAQRDTSVR